MFTVYYLEFTAVLIQSEQLRDQLTFSKILLSAWDKKKNGYSLYSCIRPDSDSGLLNQGASSEWQKIQDSFFDKASLQSIQNARIFAKLHKAACLSPKF